MIDARLVQRLKATSDREGVTFSEALNRMLWLAVIESPNMKEKEEICDKIDKMAEYCKSLYENGL
ncbi:MAG: hypothetical protein AAGB26_06285 [Planctomycetota bacterium]